MSVSARQVPCAPALGRIAWGLAFLMPLLGHALPPAEPSHAVELSGAWHVQAATVPDALPAPAGWTPLSLPGQAPGAMPAAWLEREFAVPAAWTGARFILRCELLEQAASVWVDDTPAGVFQPPGDGLDLTAFVKPGATQRLRLFIARDTRPAVPGLFQHAGCGTLGVAGSLRLDAIAPQVALVDAFIKPSVRTHTLAMDVAVSTATLQPGVVLRAHVTGQDGRSIRDFATAPAVLAAGETNLTVSFPWSDPVLWELDRPYLYTLELTAVAADGTLLDTWGPRRFGFREFTVEGREMILNGHPCRFRLLWHWGVGSNNVAFFQGIGMNAIEIQPRGRPWFSVWGRHDEIDGLADTLDEHGMALIAPLKSIEGLDPRAAAYYARACRMAISRYQNHPSILVWNLGMNICCPRQHWMPPFIGQPLTADERKVPIYSLLDHAAGTVRSLDPTRSVVSHADGNTTPVASANVYLNFIPLQEREEWLSVWSASGSKPFCGIEFGPPYVANFWHKGAPDPQFTEDAAMFVGDDAYRLEGSGYVARVAAMTASNPSGHGGNTYGPSQGLTVDLAGTQTAFFPVVTEFVRRTTRAWRTWGQNGGNHPWMWNVGFGGERSGPMGCFFYTHLRGTDEDLRRRPDWANPYYDVYRETQQPLLVYLGGPAERFTARDHAFFAGETLEKQVIAIWDGGWPTQVTARWEASISGAGVAAHTIDLQLGPGEIRKVPFAVPLPEVTHRTCGELRLTVQQDGRTVATDRFAFQVCPRPAPAAGRVLLWDPAHESDWVARCGPAVSPWQPGHPLRAHDVLVIGRNALAPADTLPFTAGNLEDGLRVLVLEQPRDVLRRFGFRAEATCSRRLFPRQPDHPLLRGLDAASLADWRGSATLLPEQWPLDLNPARPRCMHWGNYGIVASVLIEVPHHGNFASIVDGEFDLRYSPLLEWRHGAGRLVFSQFDLTGRVGRDPDATLLAHNLLAYMGTATPSSLRRTAYVGGPRGRAFVERLRLDIATNTPLGRLPRKGLVILGEVADDQAGATRAALTRFVEGGGQVLALPRTPAECAALFPFGVRTEPRAAHRIEADPALLAGIGAGLGPADLHWRDFGTFDLFMTNGLPPGAEVLGGGFFLRYRQQQGTWWLSQVDPRPFDDDVAGTVPLLAEWPEPGYSQDGGRTVQSPKPWLPLTRRRIDRLYAQVLSNLGTGPSPGLVRRVMRFVADPELHAPAAWQVAGPIRCSDAPVDPEPEWAAAHPGTPSAVRWTDVAGGWSPALPHRDDDFGCAYYARTFIVSAEAHEVDVPLRYRLSFHTSGTVWFNGQRLAEIGPNRWCPRLAIESVVRLRPGRNELLVRCTRTELQAAIQEPPDPRLAPDGPDMLYRDPVRLGDDPYAWFPW